MGPHDHRRLEPERAVGNITGLFAPQPVGDDGTRLLFREPLAAQGPVVTRLLAWNAAHFVMVRRMLEGVRERAEGNRRCPAPCSLGAPIGWLLAGAGVLGLFAGRTAAWALAGAAGGSCSQPPGLASGDWDATLAGLLAVGITLGGALAFGRLLVAGLHAARLSRPAGAGAGPGRVRGLRAHVPAGCVLALVVARPRLGVPGGLARARTRAAHS